MRKSAASAWTIFWTTITKNEIRIRVSTAPILINLDHMGLKHIWKTQIVIRIVRVPLKRAVDQGWRRLSTRTHTCTAAGCIPSRVLSVGNLLVWNVARGGGLDETRSQRRRKGLALMVELMTEDGGGEGFSGEGGCSVAKANFVSRLGSCCADFPIGCVLSQQGAGARWVLRLMGGCSMHVQ